MIHEFELKVIVRASEGDKENVSSTIRTCLNECPDLIVQDVIPTKTDDYYEFPMTWANLYRVEDPVNIRSKDQISNDTDGYCSFLFQRSDIFFERMKEYETEQYNLVKITHYLGYEYDDVLYFGAYEPEACLRKVLEYYKFDF